MARKKYTVVGGTVTTKVVDLSPPVKTEPAKSDGKRKKPAEPTVEETVEETVAEAVAEQGADEPAPAAEHSDTEV